MDLNGSLIIALAVIFFILEAHTGSGILLAAGIVTLIIGLIVLIRGSLTSSDPGLIITIVALAIAFVVFTIWRVVQIHRRRATTGREGLVGRVAIVREKLQPNGTVFLEGERWSAVSESGPIEVGQEVTITRVDGLKLYVAKANRSNSNNRTPTS